MRIVRASECRTAAWKNGGGASLDDFDWRVSMARVASDGPFSEFAGIDRTLVIVKGSGMSLTIGDAAPAVLNCKSEPIRFVGDTPTSARLLAGDIINLNVMTRRRRFEHQLQRIHTSAQCELNGHDVALAIACSGKVELTLPHGMVSLAEGDTAILSRANDTLFRIAPAVSAVCCLVLLRECRHHAG